MAKLQIVLLVSVELVKHLDHKSMNSFHNIADLAIRFLSAVRVVSTAIFFESYGPEPNGTENRFSISVSAAVLRY
jgi:hypothetical protein